MLALVSMGDPVSVSQTVYKGGAGPAFSVRNTPQPYQYHNHSSRETYLSLPPNARDSVALVLFKTPISDEITWFPCAITAISFSLVMTSSFSVFVVQSVVRLHKLALSLAVQPLQPFSSRSPCLLIIKLAISNSAQPRHQELLFTSVVYSTCL